MKNDATKNNPSASPELSAAQAQAVHCAAADVCVSAAAGSGKTRVLVERFARLVLEHGIAPGRIIAITYTQKAADELRERIERRLIAAGRDLNEHREPAIGTIHGFCLRLLQENAVDAGLDPAFRVLQGDLYEAVVEEAIEETLDEAMRGDPARFAPMLEYSDPSALKSALLQGYERARTLGRRPEPHPAPDPAGLSARIRHWAADVNAWKKELPEKQSDRIGGAADALLAEGADPEALLTALLEIGEPLRLIRRTKALEETATAFLETLETLTAETADAAAAPYNARFAELLERLAAAVAIRKRIGSWVDLHDLMDRVIELLDRPAFQARIRTEYAALLVDEYQDVNALQAKLLDRLGRGLETFVVGDARQAIYGFRHSESAFFIERFARAARSGAAVEIPENFRSRPEVVGWINQVFARRSHAGGLYGDLQARRASAGSGPAVECLWTAPPEGEKLKADALRQLDAAQAAAAILRFTAGGSVRFGDIAVLLSRMTALPAYEDAFRRAGIRYHVMRGRGFYEKNEIVDLVNLFRAVRDPEEPLYLAALLRSPFAGLRDEDIWKIFKNDRADARPAAYEDFVRWFAPLAALRRELTLSQILERALAGSAFEAVTLAQPDGLRRFANIRKFKDVLREFEGLYGSNLDAFVARLEERMDGEAEERETEAAVASERGDAVRILTVHASKGLEFPVVIAADLSGTAPKSRSAGAFVVDDDARILSNPPAPDEDGERIPSAAFLAYQETRAEKEGAESLRLFYVAATRARERLVLCGSLPDTAAGSRKKKSAVSWTDIVLEAFPESVAAVPAGFAVAPGSAPASESTLPVSTADGLWEQLQDRSRPYRQSVDVTVSDLSGAAQEADDIPDAERRTVMADGTESEATLLGASNAGRLFHEMIQHAVFSRDPKEEQARLMSDFGHRMDAAARPDFEQGIQRFLSSRLAEDLRASERAGRPIYRELPFFYRVRGESGERDPGSIKGQVDLLFEAPDGKWTLVDYKTTVAEKWEHHDQARIYAFCLKQLLRGRPHRAALYYSRDGSMVPVDLKALESEDFKLELRERFEALKTY